MHAGTKCTDETNEQYWQAKPGLDTIIIIKIFGITFMTYVLICHQMTVATQGVPN